MARSMTSKLLVVFLFCMVGAGAQSVGAQANNGPRPLDQVEVLTMPPVDVEAAQTRDAQRAGPGVPFRFAIPIETSVTPAVHGTRETLSNGDELWRLRIRSEGALSINLGFSRYVMPRGGQLNIYTPDGRQRIRPFTEADNDEHGQLWTPLLPGDEVVIEARMPRNTLGKLELELAQVNHGYREFGPRAAAKSGSCNVDVVCSAADGYPQVDAWRDQIRAVGAFSIGGVDYCSGSLVNNTAGDFTPYFLTANHCSINSGNQASVVIYWNYENSTCRPPGSPSSGQPGDGSRAQFNSGVIWRASYAPSDFTLVETDDPIADDVEPYFGGWNRGTGDTASAVAIHHPGVEEKRISFEDDPTTTTDYLGTTSPGDGTHIRVFDWDLGTTEGGSSGSPLYDENNRVVGQLHGGYAACGNNDSDWYGRFSVSWNGGGSDSTRLSNWLDPLGTAPVTLDGRDSGGITITPESQIICSGQDAVYQIDVGAAFSGPVTLSAVGNPGSAVFSPNPVNPPGTSTLTISGAAVGAYTFDVQGNDGVTTESATADLGVAAGAPAAPTLLTPANGASGVTLPVTFTWSAVADAETYAIEIASDAGFGTIVDSAAGITQPTFTSNQLLGSSMYWWRVSASNGCGDGATSSAWELITETLPGDCPLGVPAFIVDEEDFEVDPGWPTGGTGSTWAQSSARAHIGTYSYHADDTGDISDQQLETPDVFLPAAGTPLSLKYWNWQEIESSSSGCYDGGILEISTDSGSTWTQLQPELLTQPYDGAVSDQYSNPLAGLNAWCGDPADWTLSVVSLDAWAGQMVRFRFRLGSDSSVSREGWYIDGYQVQSCGVVPVELQEMVID